MTKIGKMTKFGCKHCGFGKKSSKKEELLMDLKKIKSMF
jgi:hypothetical protein